MIRVGSRVSALVGELGYWDGHTEFDANGKKRKRYKQRLHGTVVESKSDRNWLVRWDRRVDPDILEEEDDRFDVANDFELYNLDDIAEYDGDRDARKWTNYEMK